MRFTRVKIDNFFNLKDVNLDLTNGNTLIVGSNGSGKTNIIKCIHFLVNQIIDQYGEPPQNINVVPLVPEHTEPMIWNPNKKDCFIEVHAWFTKAEVELFSELRLLFLMADVGKLVHAIAQFLVTHVSSPLKCAYKVHGAESQMKKKFSRLLQDKKGIFHNLPIATFHQIIHAHQNRCNPDYGYPDLDDWSDTTGSHATSIATGFTKKLFPELLEITKRELLESQDKVRPMEGSDVVMRACTQKTVGKLEYSIDMSNDAWLPHESSRYQKKLHKVIFSALYDVFGELRGVHFCLDDNPACDDNLVPFKEAVQAACEGRYRYTQIYAQLEDLPGLQCVFRCISCRAAETGVMDLTGWGSFLSKCFEKLYRRGWSEAGLSRFTLTSCLSKSTVSCILPQRRGFIMEQDERLFTMNSLEQLLIKSMLSDDPSVQQKFSKVKDGMKSFCGIKMDVLQKEGTEVHDNKGKGTEIMQLGKELHDQAKASPVEFGHRLGNIAHKMIQKVPLWSGNLHVMVTRTLHHEDSSFSHRTPLSGLSGGEIEILMVLCTIHLSGADVVFLDEPGHSLHPPQQAQLRRWIETLQHPDPVCVTVTHSVEFISRKCLSSIYHMSFAGRGFTPFKVSVDLVEDGVQQSVSAEETAASSSTTPILAPSTSPQDVTLRKEIIAMLMRPDMRKMFFASGVYFVEGETDKVVLSAVRHHLLKNARDIKEKSVDADELLQAMDVLEMDQWDILALGGCAEALKAYKASAELRIPCAIVLDLDTITVKHGRRVEPFNSNTWKKSRLYKELTKEKQRNSLEVGVTLLEKIDSVFEEGVTESKALHETRKILREHGIWIWEGDLESAVCDNPAVRKELLKTECFMEALGEDFSSLSVSCRGKMPEKDVLTNYEERIMTPLLSLMDELRAALDSAHCRQQANPLHDVTENLQPIIGEISKYKQRLNQHHQFCQKGTKRRSDQKPSDVSPSKKFAPCPSQQDQPENAEPIVLEDTETLTDEGSTNSQPNISEEREVLYWDRIKCKLHNGGWMKLPWETLLKVLEVCLDAEPSPLQEFCKFMKEWQCRGRKKIKVSDLPRNMLSKLFP